MIKKVNNRFKLFLRINSNSFGDLTAVSLLTILFAFPLVMWAWLLNVESQQVTLGYETADAAMQTEMLKALSSLEMTFASFLLLLVPLAFLGLGGAFGVIKQIAWRECSQPSKDFFASLKKNAKVFLICGVVFGVLCASAAVDKWFILSLTSAPKVIVVVLSLLLFVVVTIVVMLVCSQAVVYENSFGAYLKNGFLIMLSSPQMLIALLFCVVPYVLIAVFQISLVSIGVVLFMAVCGCGWHVLCVFLCSCSAFDKTVNKVSFPQLVDKGLEK